MNVGKSPQVPERRFARAKSPKVRTRRVDRIGQIESVENCCAPVRHSAFRAASIIRRPVMHKARLTGPGCFVRNRAADGELDPAD
jgi:hypothetical protein